MALLAGPNIMLTTEGIRELHEELQVLQERRAGLAEFLATAADDANGIQTDLVLTDRRIGEIEMVLARAMPLERVDLRPDVVGIGSRVTVRWDGDGDETYTIVEPAEAALYDALQTVKPRADAAFEEGDYASSLKALAALKSPVDAFFDKVMVNAEDPALRANRLGLLAVLHAAMNRVADLSRLAA